MKVKICGLRDASNIEMVYLLRPDFLGFIFYEKSPRYAVGILSEKQVRSLPSDILPIGVFVNDTEKNILHQVKRFGLRGVQLHGIESPEFIRNLRMDLGNDFLILKAFGINSEFDFQKMESYQNLVQYFLLDTKTESHGGSGKKFNWDLLESYTSETPYFLSGGIGIEEIENLRENIISKPYFKNLAGLDLNSKLEDSPGNKNSIKVKEAIESTRNIIQKNGNAILSR